MTDLDETRLIYVAPATGRSGVGDYADDFVEAVAPHFANVVDYRIDTEGAETARDVVAHARAVRRLALESHRDGPTVVHFEQSGGSLSVFWSAALPREIPVTATVHDPPHPVWWPYKTAGVARHRLLHHAIHYPFRSISTAVERRVMSHRTVFALTDTGARALTTVLPRSRAESARIFVPERPPAPPVTDRPLAVGMFGHVYKGKGFESIEKLRAELPSDIGLVVAGRGTSSLPAVEGVTVLGEVNDAAEDRFFASIRLLLVPYSKHNPYGRAYPASSAVTRSYAYGTPIVCLTEGALAETVSRGGAVGVDHIDGLAAAVDGVVRDDEVMNRLGHAVARVAAEDSLANCVRPFLDEWARAVAPIGVTPELDSR
ncbi:glycosyltransferase family 1 protein [Rhodococcoides corynebacterioides]|uniref:Glycosyltransferase family 4 protein n=1 Tax=Rhodococcoides corynebacterioides TaxID=53972 RepID=A0ABS7P8A9_9NOCA|nr:glycosyltransferase family 1 protein [Rhodococcus corynebacterioides]MBY6368654.1 glycosyltransferase family 4 protein [Rhodococcus corynebacterioides]MBY6409693.1 glycosyltransferase family 4 protein [Rhodococcus corynebacterioides]